MKKSNLAVTLSMAAVFFSGILVGGFGHKLYTVRTVNAAKLPAPPKPEEFRKKYVEELRTRLSLDSQQLVQANQILDETHQRYMAMKAKYRPESEQIKAEQRDKMRAMLNATQRAEYEKILEEREKKMKEGQPKP